MTPSGEVARSRASRWARSSPAALWVLAVALAVLLGVAIQSAYELRRRVERQGERLDEALRRLHTLQSWAFCHEQGKYLAPNLQCQDVPDGQVEPGELAVPSVVTPDSDPAEPPSR